MREFDSYYELFTQNESRDRFKILYVNLLVYYVSNFNKTNIKKNNAACFDITSKFSDKSILEKIICIIFILKHS